MDKNNQNRYQKVSFRRYKNQQGNSLLEILVTFLILAVGLLGLASMQMVSLKNINNSQFHTLATVYAYEMAERMRSNRVAVLAGDYNSIGDTVSDPGCSSCTVAQVAQLDAFLWNQEIKQAVTAGGLPQGSGTVSRTGNVFSITVAWQEQQQDSAGGKVGNTDFTLNIQL